MLSSAATYIRFSLPAISLLLTGCIYEDLPPCPTGVVNVEFVWTGTPPESVDGMNIHFYPLDPDGQRWLFNIPSAKGGRVELPPGRYQAIAYNSNTRNINFEESSSYSNFHATTLIADAPADTAGIYRASSPDMLYGASLTEVTIIGDDTIRMKPLQYVARYNVILKEIDNLSAVRNISGSLNGLSAGCLMHSGEKLPTKVFTQFQMKATDNSSASGSFLNFGYLPSDNQILTIYFDLKNNKKAEFSRDVSDIISGSPNPLDVDIILTGITIPDTGGGTDHDTDVNVDGWKIHVVDIGIDPFSP